jgi:hypothetical protein
MLTRLSSVIPIVVLTAGAFAALDATPALAGGPTCGVKCVIAANRHTSPGRQATGGGGGGGGGGGAEPELMPCPADQLCGETTAGDAPPIQEVPTIDVAYNARNRLVLPAPHVHTAPRGKTFVQLRTALWVNRGDFQRETAVAEVPGQVVTAVASPKDITWNMGDGHTVTCTTAGARNGTDCGYLYERSSANQPGGRYAISVTVTWDISWTCDGDCDADTGNFADPTTSMTTNTTLGVGEVQTESRPG